MAYKKESLSRKAKWIWAKENTLKDDKVIFRKHFIVSDNLEHVFTYISVDTKYWLYINGAEVVFEGGLFRESRPGCGYVDKVDIAPYLVQGENVMTLFCWYYGNQGRNNIDSTRAGLKIECEALGIFSDESFKCLRHPAYYETDNPKPSYLYGGNNIGIDGNLEIGDFTANDFEEGSFEAARVFENLVWGEEYVRPIPQIRVGDLQKLTINARDITQYHYKLPYAMQYTPYVEVRAEGGEVISICSDRYSVNGGPGDEYNKYNCHRIEYICKPGINIFESIYYIFGEEIIISVNKQIELINIGYRETGYDTDIIGDFHCDCDILNKLIEKAKRTLYVCMRDNFMDCPDRERGQWIGDVSVQVPQTFFVLDKKAKKLIKKAISDFIHLRKGDVLVGNVPGACSSELPAQSLNAISEWGMIAQYYKYTHDTAVLKLAFEPCVRYLKLWDIGENGLVVSRAGDWKWFDHLFNVDEEVLENAWYYSALKFARKMADELGNEKHNEFLLTRIESIETNFDKAFWRGNYYTSGKLVDDRANAMAVLSGLCKKENYEKVSKVLISVFNATVYMENYVLIALCEMGYMKEAYKRMVSRYYNLAMNENTTLWEDFYILGTKNHAWSGAPITIAFKYFMGIDTVDGFKSFTLNPVKGLFENMNATFLIKDWKVNVEIKDWGNQKCTNFVNLNKKTNKKSK